MTPVRVGPGSRKMWNPWREMEGLRQEIARLIGRAPWPAAAGGESEQVFAPDVDVYDAGERFVVKADLPGVKPEDVEVSVEDNVLTMRGQRPADEARGEDYLCCERQTGRFARTIRFPVDVEAEEIKATLRHGVLEVILAKSKAAAPRKVPVAAE